MTPSRYQGHCWTSALEDDDCADVVFMPKTASVTPLAGIVPSTPPRNKQVFGLVTPPDSQSRPNSNFRSTSPPRTPVRHPDIPKDTKPLTLSGNLSEWSSDQSTTVPFLRLTGLLTPDNTPPRLSKPKFVLISDKEEATNKSELSLSTVARISETSEHHSEVIQNTKSVKTPNFFHDTDQDTSPSNLSVAVRGPQHRQSQDTATKPTTDVNSQCHGSTLYGIRCQHSVKPSAQYCHQHGYQSNSTPTIPIVSQPTTEVNSQCHELTLRDIQCRLPVKSPVQYYYQHGYQSNNTPTAPIAPTLTIEVNSRCHGLTLHGIQCGRSIKPPARYCYQHGSQSNNTTYTSSQCRGLTLRGVQCLRSVKPPAEYCYQHGSQSNNTTYTSSQCRGLTLRGIQCARSVKPPAQYCYQHGSQSTNTPTTPTALKPTADLNLQRNNIPTKPTTPTVQITVQCNARFKSEGLGCQQRVSTTPRELTKDSSQPIYFRYHIPALIGIVTHVDNEGFKVQPVGREEVFVRFHDYIPGYLQPDTQQQLRNAITGEISERVRIRGYVYALNVFDPENEGKLSLKIGYSNDVKKRHAEWKNKCRSSIKNVCGWWPQTIIEVKDDDEVLIQELIGNNRQGDKGPMAEHLERLVHIELNDLATHAPYLRPSFPDVHFSDVPRLPKADPKPCHDCNGTKHREVFSFTRVKEGAFFGREWEDIIKPVIRKWGLFLIKYFALESRWRLGFAND